MPSGDALTGDGAAWQSRPLRVVVVDDNPHDRELVALVLRNAGYEVVETSDLTSAQDAYPDVVVLDLHLGPVPPDQTYAAAEVLWPRTPIVPISGYPDEEQHPTETWDKGYGFLGLPERVEHAVVAATAETFRATAHNFTLLAGWCRAVLT